MVDLSTGWTVSPDVAAILIARPDIQAVGDTLFPNTKSQTWRYLNHSRRRITMADEIKPKLEVVHPTPEELDEEEKEFRALRRDLPGVTGAAEVGMLTVSVGRQPTPKNEFYRTHADFRPVVPLVNVEAGMDRHYIAVAPT